jgi:hypothetical protein
MSPVWAFLGLGLQEIIILGICGGLPVLAGLVVLVAVLATHRKKDEPGNE